MALQINFYDPKSQVTYTNAYIVAGTNLRIKKAKRHITTLFIYKDEATSNLNSKAFVAKIDIEATAADFDTYLSTLTPSDNMYPEHAQYEWLKTIDPDEENSPYYWLSQYNLDFKNDSTDI